MKIQTPAIIGYQIWIRIEHQTDEGDVLGVEYKRASFKELFGVSISQVFIAFLLGFCGSFLDWLRTK